MAELQEKQQEVYRLSDINKDLKAEVYEQENQIKLLEKKLATNSDPVKLKEQRDLLIDLRQKVTMYERELKLVTDQSAAEIEALSKQVENYQRREEDFKLNEQIKKQQEDSNAAQTKQLLVTTRTELE